MDTDSPHPHCPFCGLPMHFRRPNSSAGTASVLTVFDCKWCGVALNVSPRAEVVQLAAPAPGRN
jgi:hypothetical protein